MLYSPKELNNAFAQQFNSRGFHEIIDKYDIVIPNHDKVISNSYKQIDVKKYLKQSNLMNSQWSR
jgi:hypothetical protein